jgi:hypothetical protein
VIEAVKRGKYHIYPVATISEGITILAGIPGGVREKDGRFTPGSVMAKADEKLREMALALEYFGRDESPHRPPKGKPALPEAARSRRTAPRKARSRKAVKR